MYEVLIKHAEKDPMRSSVLYKIKISKGTDGAYRGAIYKGHSGRLIDSGTVSNFNENFPVYQLLKLVLQRFKSGKDERAGSTETIQTSTEQ